MKENINLKYERTTKVFAKAGLGIDTSAMYIHQQRFGLDVQFSALVLNFNNIISNGHFTGLDCYGRKSTKTIYDVSESEEKGKETSQFNVILNGNKVLEDFCPSVQYGSLNAVYKNFVVQAKDLKGLTISFEKEKGNTFINAIKIRRLN